MALIEQARQRQRDARNVRATPEAQRALSLSEALEQRTKRVEQLEENILRFEFVGQVVNVIHDEHVDHLIEMHKIVGGIIFYRINELIQKFRCLNVQNGFIGKIFLDFDSDSVCKMCFTQSGIAENEERIDSALGNPVIR